MSLPIHAEHTNKYFCDPLDNPNFIQSSLTIVFLGQKTFLSTLTFGVYEYEQLYGLTKDPSARRSSAIRNDLAASSGLSNSRACTSSISIPKPGLLLA